MFNIRIFMLALILSLYMGSVQSAWLFPDKAADITADKEALDARWNVILVEAKTYASYEPGLNPAKLPVYTTTILGNKTLKFDLNQYKDKLDAVRAFVILASVLLSFFILFS